MNGNPHLMAIIDSKMAQARTCLRNNDGARADDLLAQVGIYAASLNTHGARTNPGQDLAGTGRRRDL